MIITGFAHYAKVLGKPAWGYEKQYKEWSIDVAISADTRTALIAAGMDSAAIKNKGDDRGDFITFKRREFKKDGEPGKPIEVVDKKQQAWDHAKLIGNGSKINAKIALNEQVGKKGLKPGIIKLQVVDLVEYEGRAMDEEDLPTYADDGSVETWS